MFDPNCSERPRRAAVLAVNDPISLQVFLSASGTATGSLYLDDGQSFDYRANKFILGHFDYTKRTLSFTFDKGDPGSSQAWLERVTIVGYPSKPNRIQANIEDGPNSSQQQLAFKYDPQTHVLVIRKPALPFSQNWSIKIL